MLEGWCSECGYRCYGWALLDSRHQTCPHCGIVLKIKNGDRTLNTGRTLFTADEYFAELTREATRNKKKGNGNGNKRD